MILVNINRRIETVDKSYLTCQFIARFSHICEKFEKSAVHRDQTGVQINDESNSRA